MFTNIRSALYSIVDLIFPARDKEKIVQTLSDEDILSLPKAWERESNIYSIFSYKNPKVQALIWELKYHRNERSIDIIGKILADSILEEMSDKNLFENKSQYLLVGVPMTPRRLRQRRFSQIDLICRKMLNYLPENITYSPETIRKIRETKNQSHTKNRDERLRNLHGVFFADHNIIRGKNIILIDDVYTTGATITEATRALKSAGAKSISAFTVAH